MFTGKVDHNDDSDLVSGLSDEEKEKLQNSMGRKLGPHVPEDSGDNNAAPMKQALSPTGTFKRRLPHDPTPPREHPVTEQPERLPETKPTTPSKVPGEPKFEEMSSRKAWFAIV